MVLGICITLAVHLWYIAVTLFDDLVKLVLMVNAVVWRRACVDFEVALRTYRNTGDSSGDCR